MADNFLRKKKILHPVLLEQIKIDIEKCESNLKNAAAHQSTFWEKNKQNLKIIQHYVTEWDKAEKNVI